MSLPGVLGGGPQAATDYRSSAITFAKLSMWLS